MTGLARHFAFLASWRENNPKHQIDCPKICAGCANSKYVVTEYAWFDELTTGGFFKPRILSLVEGRALCASAV
jgi:hypothetical protein